jgi:molybdate transport system regulatory protein
VEQTENEGKRLKIKSKSWIVDEAGGVVFGPGRLHILEAVERDGSIHSASPTLRMSYRAVWGKIKATEERLGRPLVARRTGGPKGGGSELTPFGKAVLERYRQMQERINRAADEIFKDFFLQVLEGETEE